MPIYEYRCAKCGGEFEELVFADDSPACLLCGSTKTEKLMSRCSHCSGDGDGGDYSGGASHGSGGGGCAGCSGGNCASCGH